FRSRSASLRVAESANLRVQACSVGAFEQNRVFGSDAGSELGREGVEIRPMARLELSVDQRFSHLLHMLTNEMDLIEPRRGEEIDEGQVNRLCFRAQFEYITQHHDPAAGPEIGRAHV